MVQHTHTAQSTPKHTHLHSLIGIIRQELPHCPALSCHTPDTSLCRRGMPHIRHLNPGTILCCPLLLILHAEALYEVVQRATHPHLGADEVGLSNESVAPTKCPPALEPVKCALYSTATIDHTPIELSLPLCAPLRCVLRTCLIPHFHRVRPQGEAASPTRNG